MKFSHIAQVVLALLTTSHASLLFAQTPEGSSWYRDIAISPNGEQIAFTFNGQIWLANSEGGDAVPLTRESVHSSNPVWSSDGELLAYEANQYGPGDVFVLNMQTHTSQRLTFHGSKETPYSFSADGSQVLFQSQRIGNGDSEVNNGYFGRSNRLYAIPASGGREQVLLANSVSSYSVSHDGRQALYTDLPSYTEQPWRKGSLSDAARNIWKYDVDTQTHTQVTTFRGEDRNAVWADDDQSMYFLSERSGSFNVWKQSLNGHEDDAVAVTHHTKLPVRFLSISQRGDLAYGFDGGIWLKKNNEATPHQVDIRIPTARSQTSTTNVNLGYEITEMAASPTAPEIAVVARGEIFVISTLTGETRRITNTPQAERNVSFSSDGRTLIYGSERKGSWDLFSCHISEQDKSFFTAAQITEQQLTDTPIDETQPVLSPDDQRVAYRTSRNTLKVMTLEDGSTTTLISSQSMYSYEDADWHYQWSPDGEYIVSRDGSTLSANNILLLDSFGQHAPITLSYSGFSQTQPKFSDDGQMVYWTSEKGGLTELDGSAVNGNVYAVTLNKRIEARLGLSQDQAWLAEQQEQSAEQDNGTSVDVHDLQDRIHRITPYSMSVIASYLSPDNTEMVVANHRDDDIEFVHINLVTGDHEVMLTRSVDDIKSMTVTQDRSTLLLIGDGQLEKIDLASGQSEGVHFSLEAEYDFTKEKQYIFDHVWRLTKTKFYDKDLHGVNWEWYRGAYEKHLPSIHNYIDFAELLSELAGELNASHTGATYFGHPNQWESAASLGLIYDDKYQGKGIRVRSILRGGPADLPGKPIKAGSIIYSVNGIDVLPGHDIYPLLNNLEGKLTRLSVLTPGNQDTISVVTKPISLSGEAHLAYKRWVTKREELTERLSKGRIGYIHLPEMDNAAYRQLVNKLFGLYRDKEAVVIDVRYNTGGNLHDQIMQVLSGVRHSSALSRDGYSVGTFPLRRWAKPSIMLANASSYSDGSIVPYFYQKEGIGKLVGEPVPGTGTFVLWEIQQEPFLDYGVPQLGFKNDEGKWLENNEVKPDIVAYNSPADVAANRDHQLNVAINALLATLE
ncbi:S41 family peptidase (plasmid) [Vibrio tubiashii]|uniref:S41 family peptidase n=1 Tax=Vibrio tubiashii TaxID=29498 RepID=UPI00234F3D2F|nr:S41 family peptidase [Vibrio tubiashii]WCP70321.1 S41 family peptidase [Vibrio tubiashii]